MRIKSKLRSEGDVSSFATCLFDVVCRRNGLTVNHLTLFVLIGVKVFAILVHSAQAHAHVRETAIVEQRLHGHLTCEVAEKCHAVVGAIVGCSVA